MTMAPAAVLVFAFFSFTGALRPPSPLRLSAGRRGVARRATYDVTLQMPDGETVTFPCADDEFIIDAAEDNGIEMPASCRSGARPRL